MRARDLARAIAMLRAAGFSGRRTPIGAKLHDGRTGVDVDLIATAFDGDERALARARRARSRLPVVSVTHLILMKLEAGRSQADADVVALLKAGASRANVARYLRRAWPTLLPRFERLAERCARRRRGPGSK